MCSSHTGLKRKGSKQPLTGLYINQPGLMCMTSLNDLENAEVPGVGNVDVTDPSSHIQLITGVVALLGAVGVGNYLFGKLKSATGSEAIQGSVPEV